MLKKAIHGLTQWAFKVIPLDKPQGVCNNVNPLNDKPQGSFFDVQSLYSKPRGLTANILALYEKPRSLSTNGRPLYDDKPRSLSTKVSSQHDDKPRSLSTNEGPLYEKPRTLFSHVPVLYEEKPRGLSTYVRQLFAKLYPNVQSVYDKQQCLSTNVPPLYEQPRSLLTSAPLPHDKPRNLSMTERTVMASNVYIRGIDYLEAKNLNKSLAFTIEERQALGIHGLLAPQFRSIEDQLQVCKISLSRLPNDLNRYLYLTELNETNERLFYKLINNDIEKYMPIVHGPTVGAACQTLGLVFRRPRGLFVTIHDRGHIIDVLKNWPNENVKSIVFTDGERTQGLGDSGIHGFPIPVGKLSLYTALGRIYPEDTLPIILDCGTDNTRLLEDPLYVGLRQERIKGNDYDEFIEEFLEACREVFGGCCLLQFEDFSLRNAPRLLDKYKYEHCIFNDDIQGTAAVVLAGLISSSRITTKKLSDNEYLFLGAGSAATGIANLLVDAIMEEGLTRREAHRKIWMYDEDGLLSSRRINGVPKHAAHFAKNVQPDIQFSPKSVAMCKASVLIGTSTAGGAFTPEVLNQMARNTGRPVVFALSNPVCNAECTAQEAYENTDGRCIFVSGSPFPPVRYLGVDFFPGQANNAYIFPGLALGATSVCSYRITDSMFLAAAKRLAALTTDHDLELGRVYPPIRHLPKVALAIAGEVAQQAYQLNLAGRYPEPDNLLSHIGKSMYNLDYTCYVPKLYYYP